MISARRTGVEPDARAGALFRRAAAQLSSAAPNTEERRDAAAAAGVALVGLALAEAEDELRVLLTPDPSDLACVWTVACYQIGDLTPSALRDFSDPVEAVATAAACPDESHVAAELITSTARGLHWTAVTRTNDTLLLQLPSAETASDGSRERAADLARALDRWRVRLDEWAESDGCPTTAEQAALGIGEGNGPDAVAPMVVAEDVRVAGLDVQLGAVLARLAALEGRLTSLEVALASIANMQRSLDARSTPPRPVEASGSLAWREVDALEQTMDLRFRALAACFNELVNRFADQTTSTAQQLARHEDTVERTVRAGTDDVARHVDALARELGGLSTVDERRRFVWRHT